MRKSVMGILLLVPLLGGCKMMMAKAVVSAVAGPEQAEKLDPVARVRRSVMTGVISPDPDMRQISPSSPATPGGLTGPDPAR